jgi:hypothetical protein
MSKLTAAAVEHDLNDALFGFKDKATAVKAAHASARKEIQEDTRRTAVAKKEDLDALRQQTKSKLEAIKGEQESYVKDLRDRVEREFRGSQPADAASIVSRRDASARARLIQDKREAMEALQDAIAGNDPDFAHAIGVKARNVAWVDVAEVYQAAHPTTAASAEALSSIDRLASGPAYNVSNSITYSAPE